jgi:hypothetical protein
VTGGHAYVLDAANWVHEVLTDGTVQILTYFPNESFSDSLQSCVAQAPDGAL